MPQSFCISIKIGFKAKSIKVEYIPVDDRVEHFRLHGNSIITLESNRPLFRNKGIKHRKPNYKLIDGKVHYPTSLDPFIEKINEYFETHIPVKFLHQGKEVHGMLGRVSGAGKDAGMYHLEVDNYHWGRLSKTDKGWQWGSNTHQDLDKYSEYFGNLVAKEIG